MRSPQKMVSVALRAVALSSLVLASTGCDDDPSTSPPDASQPPPDASQSPPDHDGSTPGPTPPPTGERDSWFAQACVTGSDCPSEICVAVATSHRVCSAVCASAADCPQGWSCDGGAGPMAVCQCTRTSEVELCGDGIDNDCDGVVDDCAGQCSKDEDCADDIDCTEETCSEGRCVRTLVSARCGAGEVCDLRSGGCREGVACAVDADCDDGDPCTTEERCDQARKVCLWVPLDGDGDGEPPLVCGGTDCDDADPATHPGAPEQCDGVDNDCDGKVDAPLPADACGPFGQCVDGTCDCTSGADQGWLECGGLCINVRADEANCGACGRTCEAGFVCSDRACRDVDECAEGLLTCPERARCVNVRGSARCECAEGYTLRDGQCVNVDECDCAFFNINDCHGWEGPCARDARCADTDGGYTCTCENGFVGDGGVACTRALSCAELDCGPLGRCEVAMSNGRVYCVCEDGYRWDDARGGCEPS